MYPFWKHKEGFNRSQEIDYTKVNNDMCSFARMRLLSFYFILKNIICFQRPTGLKKFNNNNG